MINGRSKTTRQAASCVVEVGKHLKKIETLNSGRPETESKADSPPNKTELKKKLFQQRQMLNMPSNMMKRRMLSNACGNH